MTSYASHLHISKTWNSISGLERDEVLYSPVDTQDVSFENSLDKIKIG